MAAVAIPAPKSASPTWRFVRDAFRRHPTAIAGAVVLLAMVLIALLAPWLGTTDPLAVSPIRRLRPPSAEYWFGTDMLGRDVYTRVIYGTRVSLIVGFAVGEAAPPVPEEPPFEIHKSFLQPAAEGPVGLAVTPAAGHRADVPDPRHDPNRPANAQTFFSIYFLLTGLHGIHVLIGMMVISWLLFRALRDEFGPSYFTPVDLGGLYWHLVDVIWIFLFPLLYLIK